MPETPISESVSTRQQRIATLAKQAPQRAFMSLNHYEKPRPADSRGRSGRSPKGVGSTGTTRLRNSTAHSARKLRGHNAYYGITGNSPSLWRYREEVKRLWRKWLYRCKRGRGPGWSWFYRLLERYPLPNAVTYHSVYHREAKV